MRIVRLGRVIEWDTHSQRAWTSEIEREREGDSISKRQFRTYGAKITLQSAPSRTQSFCRFLLIIFVFAIIIIIIMNHSFFRLKLNWHFFFATNFFLFALSFSRNFYWKCHSMAQWIIGIFLIIRHFLLWFGIYIFFFFGFDWIEKAERMRLYVLLSKPKIHKGAER